MNKSDCGRLVGDAGGLTYVGDNTKLGLGEIPAVDHGDGGQHTREAGMEQQVAVAIRKCCELREELDAWVQHGVRRNTKLGADCCPAWVPPDAEWAAEDDEARWFYAGGVMYLSLDGREFFTAESAGTLRDPDAVAEDCLENPSFRVVLDRRGADAWVLAARYRRALRDLVDAVVKVGLELENKGVSVAVQRAKEVLR